MKRKYLTLLCVLISIALFVGVSNNVLKKKNVEKEDQQSCEISEEVMKETQRDDSDDIGEEYNANDRYEEIVEEYEYIYIELTDEEMKRIDKVIRDYYIKIGRKIIRYVQFDSTYHHTREYKGYNAEELVIFEVIVEDSEIPRNIVIGSKNEWNDCKVLNEGY